MGLLAPLTASEQPQTLKQLAEKCDTDELLTLRVLRCLESHGCIDSQTVAGEVAYSGNHISRLYTTDRGILHMRWLHGVLQPALVRIPQKVADNGFHSLTTGANSVLSDLYGKPEANMWQLLSSDDLKTFKSFVPTYNAEHVDWLEFYPAQDCLLTGAKSKQEEALFVDVGGNTGYQAAAFRSRFPNAVGRIILQDLPGIVETHAPGIEAMAHDFFKPQPVRGARAYYLRFILHDWCDDDNAKILRHLRDAMEPGYSKLLIHDWVLSDQGASMLMTSMDLCMMAVSGGEERSLAKHRKYMEAAGLCITKVYDLEDGKTESIIECERA